MVAKVEIAIACSSMQSHEWWGPVMGEILAEQKTGDIEITGIQHAASALPDNAKNRELGGWVTEKKRPELTDMNRSSLTEGFLQRSKADWIWWLDDDTVPPKGALTRLLEIGRDFIGGLYFLGGGLYNPVAYVRTEDNLYKPLYNYTHGTLTQVDSIGMGCTLIHRSVYERIMDGHVVFQRPNASLFAFPKDKMMEDPYFTAEYKEPVVVNGHYIVPVKAPGDDDNRPWPFYAMEYSRTEDHHFCELAANVGIKPWLDTTIVCDHWKLTPISRADYLAYKETHDVALDNS